jgi:hypothetical protein
MFHRGIRWTKPEYRFRSLPGNAFERQLKGSIQMGLIEPISNGWSMAKASFGVLRMDPELLLFPVVSAMTCMIVLASFALPLLGMGDNFLTELQDDQTTSADIIAYVMMFLFYFAN